MRTFLCLVAARVPGTKMTAIYNTYKRSCAEYTPIELFIMDSLDDVAEDHPLIERLSGHGARLGPGRPPRDRKQPRHAQQIPEHGRPSHDDTCYGCVWLPLCGGGCPQMRLFGKPECPAYRNNPEEFVLAMNARVRRKG